MNLLLLVLLAVLALPTAINSEDFIVHGGRLNGEGCHNEKKMVIITVIDQLKKKI